MPRDQFSDVILVKDTAGNVFVAEGAQFTVYRYDPVDGRVASPLPELWQDRTGSFEIDNPHVTADGRIQFWADPGDYDIVISLGGTQIDSFGWSAMPAQPAGVPGAYVDTIQASQIVDTNQRFGRLGEIIDWFRPPGSTWDWDHTLWKLCDGTTCLAAQHDFPGVGDFVLPSLIDDRTVIGVPLARVRENGEADGHVHAAGTLALPAHWHSISSDSHSHYTPWPVAENTGGGNFIALIMAGASGAVNTMVGAGLRSRLSTNYLLRTVGKASSAASAATVDGNQADYPPRDDVAAFYDVRSDIYTHSHGAATGSTVGGSSAVSGNTASGAGMRPRWYGAVKLLRVKRS